MSYRWIAAFCAVAALNAGTFEAVAAAEPVSDSSVKAPVAAPSTSPSTATAAPHGAHGAKPAARKPAAPPKKVDINNASLDELKKGLPVGDAEARKIIEHRPYQSKGELLTKAGLPEGIYHAVKRNVEVQKPRKAAAKK